MDCACASDGHAITTTHRMIRRHPLAAYFLLADAVSWLLWAPLWLPALGFDALPVLPYQHAFGALGPIAAAFLVSGAETGRPGIRDLLQRMLLWRGRLGWIAVASLAPVALLALAIAAARALGSESVALRWIGRSHEFPQFSAIAFLTYSLISFGFGEETGWRGFALPRLQARHSALVASLLLTIGWAVWHVPLFFYRPGYLGMSAAGIAGWLFSLVTGSVLLTWLYNGSRGSLIVVAIFHAAIDVVFTSAEGSSTAVNAAGALITVWGVVVVVVAGPTYLSWQGKMVRNDRGTAITGPESRNRHLAADAVAQRDRTALPMPGHDDTRG
jgi:membrane protease YdiL (CAAX protease family)